MGSSTTPPVVRDEPPRNRGPDLWTVGTDLVICEGEAMTYGEYCRGREVAERREQEEADAVGDNRQRET